MAFEIVDDFNVPKEVTSVTYFGPDPFRIYTRISPLLQIIFQGKGEDVYEDDFRWDNSGDPQSFYFRFRLEKGLDKWTRSNFVIRVYGHQPKDPAAPSGRMTIEFMGTLRTSYPVGSDSVSKALFVPFLYLYHYVMYNQIRRRYLLMYATRIEKFMNELRAILGIMQKPRLT
ncbi:MAG: hypothetical protein HY361_02920 [Candidatus Aenigmarchaeota archaeon]|nr:hypothetical protein [Candidatus Aenigmarchaeota archaeon]